MTNASDYGLVGDGTTPNDVQLQNAIDATPPGGTLYFSPGTYLGNQSSPYNNPSAYVKITKPIHFQGSPNVVFKNILFWIQGEYSTTTSLISAVPPGAKEVALATPHDLSPGDYVQFRSEYSTYSPEAGIFQMGGPNPSTNATTYCPASEIHRVASVNSSSVLLYGNTRYNYPTASVQKLVPVQGVSFNDITFDYSTNSIPRGILARVVSDLSFNNCTFIGGPQAGRHFGCTDVYNLQFNNVTARRNIQSASGSSWNSFIVGGGTTLTTINNSNFHGEYQNIDFSPNRLVSASDPGSNPDTPSNSTTQDISVVNNDFYDCANSTTTHPGCFDFTYTNNRVHSGSIGVLVRSRRSSITNNTFHTANAGVILSSYVEDSRVSDNLFTFTPSENRPSPYYDGIIYAPTSSEIQTNNRLQSLSIRNNVFRSTSPTATQWGIRLAHQPPLGYTPSNSVKIGLSRILIENNYFEKTSINVGSYINGTTIKDNTFLGGSAQSHYIRCDEDSARTIITDNTFNPTSTCRGVKTSSASSTLFTYTTVNLIGPQRWIYSGATLDLENATNLIQSSGV